MDDKCLRCGFTEDHQQHNSTNPPPEGWHPFRGMDYLDALEDALLFVREKKAPHQWERDGIIVGGYPGFEQKHCMVCGGINWGGKEDGICFGKHEAENAVVAAHNRRASKLWGSQGLIEVKENEA
jgi:hypothetical protein